jgi:uncharacterized metal-binding protein
VKKEKPIPGCGRCDVPSAQQWCRTGKGKAPPFCPSVHYRELAQEVFADSPAQEKEFLKNSAIQEHDGYYWRPQCGDTMPAKPRVVEIVEFARRMGYKKLGFIFCIGLRDEAAIMQEILEVNNFVVVSSCCKVGCQPKSSIGIPREMQINPSLPEESMCNPRLQATLMNEAQVEFNVMLGLCVGHDSVAIKHLRAPVTVLASKDRLTGHNPLVPIYMYHSYYAYLKKPLP